MRVRNTANHYGLITIVLHWLVALVVIGMFALGLWMVELSYYDPWYKKGPDLHRSIGVILFAVMLLRLLWRLLNPIPNKLASHRPVEHALARITHGALYLLLFGVMASGYLISTADGRPIMIFDWIAIPATLSGIENQEDVAGEMHFILAVILISLAGLHALAALKHHFIDRDATLRRMLGKRSLD